MITCLMFGINYTTRISNTQHNHSQNIILVNNTHNPTKLSIPSIIINWASIKVLFTYGYLHPCKKNEKQNFHIFGVRYSIRYRTMLLHLNILPTYCVIQWMKHYNWLMWHSILYYVWLSYIPGSVTYYTFLIYDSYCKHESKGFI